MLLAALVGAGLGFLVLQRAPAMVFMGDTGSLRHRRRLGAVAVVTKYDGLAIVGGLFVLETRLGHRRSCPSRTGLPFAAWRRRIAIFPSRRAGPSPPSFSGFWIIAAILSMIGLATLKLR